MAEKSATVSYQAPPIIEAVIQMIFAEPLSDAQQRKLARKLKKNYANVSPTAQITSRFDPVSVNLDIMKEEQERFSSADQADILILMQVGLTWSRLAPYQGWDAFIARVRADLDLIYDVLGVRKLARMGVRYINRLDVPIVDGVASYEHYIAINISLPTEIPVVEQYGWRLERHLADKGALVILQSASGVQEVPGTNAFLLDIDVICTVDLPLKLDAIFTKLEDMRQIKNDHFEMAITPKARETFSL
ncbi:TIGR04255 family protein [Sphingobium sp. CAP-1]|uniref:TIGR04255 family protein n=1 Tax=Sphingobium sp. CAP-1 TaxID=2676077 RepID=UPI0012BB3B33|nr:TIGR04255 family protein [Sphingobium sp. CAP-1]QGP79987.1 TIGR04255 family protein [Sphingobium sp. CAP-1]